MLKILLLCVALFTCGQLWAGEAVFSADGKTVYAIPYRDTTGLWKIDVASGEAEIVPIPKELGTAEIVGLARSNSGFILLATSKEVWAWDVAKNKASKAVSMKEDSFWDISYEPTGSILIMDHMGDGEGPFIAPRGWKYAGHMFARRVPAAANFAFDDKGHAYFSEGADLWAGSLSWWDMEENDVPKEVATQEDADVAAHGYGPEAARILGVGVMQTNSSNQRNLLIQSIVVSTNRVYVWLGNRDYADLISVPKKKIDDATGDNPSENLSDVESFMKLSGALLQDTRYLGEKIGHENKRGWLCVSPDHRKVFVHGKTDEGEAIYLITDDGEPKKIADFTGGE